MAKMDVRKERERQKLEKKQLAEQGKGLAPDEIGWKFEKQIAHEPKSEPEFKFERKPKP